jgi:hypothetical protein
VINATLPFKLIFSSFSKILLFPKVILMFFSYLPATQNAKYAAEVIGKSFE